jgi:hypothetical protein
MHQRGTLNSPRLAPRVLPHQQLQRADQRRSSSKYATRSVLALAQAVSAAKPSASTAAPHAAITHQIACVAVAKSVPSAWLAFTTVPDTATPEPRPLAGWSMQSLLQRPPATAAFQPLHCR